MKLYYSYMRRLCAYITDRLHQSKRFLQLSIDGLGLSCPVFTKATGILPVALVCFHFVCFAQESPAVREATGIGEIKPLQIGDTIPEELWHMPLQVVNHPDGKDTITLNDYRGSILLLDFLSTGCPGCIKALPGMEEVASSFDGEVVVLPITQEQADRVQSFRKQNHMLKDSKLAYVVEDTTLKQYFPHQYISHVVWIDKDKKVKAITGTEQVRNFTITDFLSGKSGNWVIKTETTDFFNEQLVVLNPKTEALINNIDAPLAYAAFSGFLEGVGRYYQTEMDTLQGVERVSLRNISLFDFGLISLGLGIFNRGLIFQQHPENWQVQRPERYAYELANSDRMTRSAWRQKYAICYERTFPLGISKKEKQKHYQQDLENLMGIKIRQEEKNGIVQLIFTETIN